MKFKIILSSVSNGLIKSIDNVEYYFTENGLLFKLLFFFFFFFFFCWPLRGTYINRYLEKKAMKSFKKFKREFNKEEFQDRWTEHESNRILQTRSLARTSLNSYFRWGLYTIARILTLACWRECTWKVTDNITTLRLQDVFRNTFERYVKSRLVRPDK